MTGSGNRYVQLRTIDNSVIHAKKRLRVKNKILIFLHFYNL